MKSYTSELKKWEVYVTVPSFGANLTESYLRALSFYGPETALKSEQPKGKNPKTFTFEFANSREWAKDQFVKSLIDIFKPEYLSFTVVQKDMFNDAWEELEYRLKNHDWTYMFSDDHRVWAGGQASIDTINRMMEELEKIDKKRVNALWKKYQPKS